MRAQFSIDYYVALIIFILLTTYISFQVLAFSPLYTNEINSQRLRSEAFQISEILINDAGQPVNWENVDENSIKRIGLSNESFNYTNFLSTKKISALKNLIGNPCSQTGYGKIKGWLDVQDDFSFSLINKTSETTIISCNPPQKVARRTLVNISRIVSFDSGDYGILNLEVW
jgi:hypothetical protein